MPTAQLAIERRIGGDPFPKANIRNYYCYLLPHFPKEIFLSTTGFIYPSFYTGFQICLFSYFYIIYVGVQCQIKHHIPFFYWVVIVYLRFNLGNVYFNFINRPVYKVS